MDLFHWSNKGLLLYESAKGIAYPPGRVTCAEKTTTRTASGIGAKWFVDQQTIRVLALSQRSCAVLQLEYIKNFFFFPFDCVCSVPSASTSDRWPLFLLLLLLLLVLTCRHIDTPSYSFYQAQLVTVRISSDLNLCGSAARIALVSLFYYYHSFARARASGGLTTRVTTSPVSSA